MKNWKSKLLSTSFFLIAFLLFSCKEILTDIKIELPTPKPKFVVHSTFTPFTPPVVKSFSVFVSRNAKVFDTLKIDPITDATVKLFVDGQYDQVLKFYPVNSNYVTKFHYYPKVGVEYSVSVEKQGFETVTAKGVIPEKVTIENCKLIPFAGIDQDKLAFSQISVSFDDPADQTNYYEIMVLGYMNENDKKKLYTTDKVITSESYYPSQVDFAANQPKRLLFSDKLINGENHVVDLTYKCPQEGQSGGLAIIPHLIFLSFRSVSESYYRYYTNLFKQINNREIDMLFGMAEPSPVYTNIENGYGVFAGYSEDNRSFWVDSIRVR